MDGVQTTQQNVTTILDVSENTTGDAYQFASLNRVYQVVITGTATVAIQVSVDGSTWATIRTATASEAISTAEPWPYTRAVSSGMSSATAKVYVGE